MSDWSPIWITFKLAFITTILLLFVSMPLCWWLSRSRSRFRPVVETLVSMPLVLPPTVLGFYLLIAFSPNYAFGHFLEKWFDLRLIFSFTGLVLASMIYSLPFMVQPVVSGLTALPVRYREASYSLGKSEWTTFFRILLPNIRPALVTGTVLAFAHTIGEFGVILMIGGSIPGKTRVASVAIFEEVESMNYSQAHAYAGILLAITFIILLIVNILNRRMQSAYRK